MIYDQVIKGNISLQKLMRPELSRDFCVIHAL